VYKIIIHYYKKCQKTFEVNGYYHEYKVYKIKNNDEGIDIWYQHRDTRKLMIQHYPYNKHISHVDMFYDEELS